MRVILFRPKTFLKKLGIVSVQYPINLGYLSAYLKHNGVEVKVFDLEVMDLSDEKISRSLKEFGPDVVGITSMTPTIAEAHRIAELCKKDGLKSLVVIGGVHSSAIPIETLTEFPSFDAVIIGEGEFTLLETVRKVSKGESLKGTAGLIFRENGGFNCGPRRELIVDINELPFPDREMAPIELYSNSHVSRGFSRRYLKIAEVMMSRGCPYFCTFCASRVTFGRKTRFRTIDNIKKEVDLLVTKYHVNHLSILDDTFTLQKDLLKDIAKTFKGYGLTWDCFSRVDRIDLEMVRMMVDCGCRKISFGVESGSERVLKAIRKNITPEQVRKTFKVCKQAGMKYVEGTFILGSDVTETIEDIKETEKLIHQIKPDILGCFTICPYPGTHINKIMKERGYLKKENWEEFVLYGGNPSWRLDNFTMEDLKDIQKKLLRKYYLRPGAIFNTVRKLDSPKEFLYLLSGGVQFIKSMFRLA